jgi:uncharacterized protein (DUF433 family)/DNA-binding transcriptional MerR regulator
VAQSRSKSIGHYSAADVGRLAGVSAKRVGSWSRYGIIPRVSTKPKVYSYADAGEAVLVRYLLDQEIPTKQIREIVENLRKEYGQWPLAAAPLEHAGPFVVVREGDNIYFSALDAEQRVIAGTLIDLHGVREALRHGGWAAYKHPREHIEVDPDLHSGQPVVRGSRLPTETVAEIAREHDGWRILREDYGLSEAEIQDALGYEDDVTALVA